MLKHVGSLAGVHAGTWYFDYDADKIYFADDPSGKTVETSVTKYAFYSHGSGVTIRGLIIEKYASPAQYGAIGGQGGVPRWTLQNNEVRWNHGSGIRTGNAMQVLQQQRASQRPDGDRRLGRQHAGPGQRDRVQQRRGLRDPTGRPGRPSSPHTNALVVRDNFSHHNDGAGLWTDIDNINSLYEGNRVEDNDWRGIYHEISYKAIIRNNIIRRNGFNLPLKNKFPVDGAGILIHDSQNVEIYGNTVENNYNGIGGIESNRGSGKYGVYNLINLNVHDNSVVQPNGRAAGVAQVVGSNAVYSSQGNKFVHNTYDLGTTAKYFRWMNGDHTTPEWKGYGMDVTGIFK